MSPFWFTLEQSSCGGPGALPSDRRRVIAPRVSGELEDDLVCMGVRLGAKHESSLGALVEISANVNELERLREWLGEALRESAPLPLNSETVFEIQLAVQEAATNVIRHGVTRTADPRINVRLTFQSTVLSIELRYVGAPFSRDAVPLPSFDGSRDHGFGLYLIDQLMDEATYACAGGENTIVLTKRLEQQRNRME